MSYPLDPVHRLTTPYHGLPGRGRAFRTLKRPCVTFNGDGDLEGTVVAAGANLRPTVVLKKRDDRFRRDEPCERISGRGIQRENMKDRGPITRKSRGTGVSHLFNGWPRLIRRIKSTPHLALFLDFDGTLTPLRRRPEDVPPLDLPTRRLLRGLANRRGLDVYVISGRRLADLKARVPVPGAALFGLYGWEGPSVPSMRRERELIRKAKKFLRSRLAGLKQVWLEDKKLALAVHYRGAPLPEVRATCLAVQGSVQHFQPQLRLLDQKKAWELLPSSVGGKNSAVLRLLAKPRQPTLAIYVGDDAADESAFAALPHGITVRVGNTPRTHARFYLRGPREVITFLQRLEAELA